MGSTEPWCELAPRWGWTFSSNPLRNSWKEEDFHSYEDVMPWHNLLMSRRLALWTGYPSTKAFWMILRKTFLWIVSIIGSKFHHFVGVPCTVEHDSVSNTMRQMAVALFSLNGDKINDIQARRRLSEEMCKSDEKRRELNYH